MVYKRLFHMTNPFRNTGSQLHINQDETLGSVCSPPCQRSRCSCWRGRACPRRVACCTESTANTPRLRPASHGPADRRQFCKQQQNVTQASQYNIKLKSQYSIKLKSQYNIKLKSQYNIKLKSQYNIKLNFKLKTVT